ncbi:MAG TPA: PriCT-2 domain-containing protein, partial [Gammaproteobacteria bacterium]|nr:PriCT-2 domain-containing protein [Gammaproteobacteria bacterium]
MNQIKTARSALNYLDSGCSRDDWVRLGMAAKAAGLEFEDFHNWSKFGGNYSTEKDCKAAWKSFNESGGITAATLFHIAKGKGWKDPFKTISNTSNEKLHCTKRKAPKTLHTNEQSTRVLEIWEKCVSASPAHEYIMRKQGRPDSLRVYPTNAPTLTINGQNVADYLVVPCLSDGIPQTLQFISPKEGKKLNLGGASFNDGYFVVGNITETTPKIYPTESIGNAWAIFQASNAPSVVFFGSSRMPRVTKLLRDKYPNTQLILVPDRGKENQAAEIASDIDCHWIALPQDKHENYDVNDYAHEYSYDALATLLGNVKASEMRYKLLSGADLIGMPPMGWLVRGVIPNKGLAALYGANGSGKSFLILDMGCAVAAGDKFWFGHSITQVPVTYVSLEGEAGMGKRVKAWSL